MQSFGDSEIQDQIESKNTFKKNIKERRIYPSKPPSYHYDKNCDLLTSNYENFDIPPAIKHSDIEEYRSFFLENIELYRTSYEYFIARAELKFDVKIESIKQDLGNNSRIAHDDDVDIKLLSHLGVIQDKLDEMMKGDPKLYAVYRYMPYKNVCKIKKQEIKSFKDDFIIKLSEYK